jgi:cytochrome c-type protein NapB
MKAQILLTAAGFWMLAGGAASGAEGLDPTEMGLSKTSVFESPSPKVFEYRDVKPRDSAPPSKSYPTAPPQIPHAVDDYLPITAPDENLCLGCHDKPRRWDEELQKGKARPMPRSHYTDLRTPGAEPTRKVRGARFFCTQCHAPVANVELLIQNEFKPVTGAE